MKQIWWFKEARVEKKQHIPDVLKRQDIVVSVSKHTLKAFI